MLQGRHEVKRLQGLVQNAFDRYGELPIGSQVQSDFSRYLCVLVAGYMEQAVQELALAWCRSQSSPSVQRFAGRQLSRLQNLNPAKLAQTVGSFSADWQEELETDLADELVALGTVVANRHLIAHGGTVGVSFVRISESFVMVQDIVDFLIERFDPAP
mgnify:CR=1 FL=1